MGISIFCIMLFHQGWIWNKIHVLFLLFHMYGNWGVDIFFFVSGFGLYHSLKKNGNVIAFYHRRLLRLLPMCFTCGIVRYWIDHLLPVGIGGYPTGEHEISSNWATIFSLDKWFIAVIVTYYLIMPVLFKLVNRIGERLVCIAFLIAVFNAIPLIEIPLLNTQYTSRLPAFCLGVVTAACPIIYNKREVVISYIALLLAFVYKILIYQGVFHMYDAFTYIILSIGLIQLCVLIANTYRRYQSAIWQWWMNIMNFLGRHSLELYLWHEFIYRYTYRFLINTPIPLFIQMVIGMSVSLFIAYFHKKIMDKVLDIIRI